MGIGRGVGGLARLLEARTAFGLLRCREGEHSLPCGYRVLALVPRAQPFPSADRVDLLRDPDLPFNRPDLR